MDGLPCEDESVSYAAHRALQVLSRRELPRNAKKWTAWWEEARRRPRMDWLIDALSAPKEQTRIEAARELKLYTGEDFGYRPEMNSEARAAVQRRYRTWLEQDGGW